jgi:hypothetical protein
MSRKRMVVVEISREMSASLDKAWDMISDSVKRRFTEAPFESPRMNMTAARMVIDEKRGARRNCKNIPVYPLRV